MASSNNMCGPFTVGDRQQLHDLIGRMQTKVQRDVRPRRGPSEAVEQDVDSHIPDYAVHKVCGLYISVIPDFSAGTTSHGNEEPDLPPKKLPAALRQLLEPLPETEDYLCVRPSKTKCTDDVRGRCLPNAEKRSDLHSKERVHNPDTQQPWAARPDFEPKLHAAHVEHAWRRACVRGEPEVALLHEIADEKYGEEDEETTASAREFSEECAKWRFTGEVATRFCGLSKSRQDRVDQSNKLTGSQEGMLSVDGADRPIGWYSWPEAEHHMAKEQKKVVGRWRKQGLSQVAIQARLWECSGTDVKGVEKKLKRARLDVVEEGKLEVKPKELRELKKLKKEIEEKQEAQSMCLFCKASLEAGLEPCSSHAV